MHLISLDCTLRDGGYVNNWQFSQKHMIKIVSCLCQAGVEVIECGFINSLKGKENNTTLFNSIERVSYLLQTNLTATELENHSFVVMANYGDYDFSLLPDRDAGLVDGIRVAFHKKDRKEIRSVAKTIIEQGYKFYLQPMVTAKYSDDELLDLLQDFSDLPVFAYYIVDSFGSMYPKELIRLFYLFNENVSKSASIGFHSHNNMQLAFANAIELLSFFSTVDRDIIIDSSIFGMGRGAGNLNTELFLSYCNRVHDKKYQILPLLEVIDSCLEGIHKKNYWGYSGAHYLSALYSCHPNYANYLMNKQRLKVADIEAILQKVVQSKVVGFDEALVETKYIEHVSSKKNQKASINLPISVEGRSFVILASGRSTIDHIDFIKHYIEKENPFFISVNHVPDFLVPDVCFFSNIKRLEEFEDKIDKTVLWTTSDLNYLDSAYVVDYHQLIDTIPNQNDDAAILLVSLMMLNKVSNVKLIGLDGFSINEPFSNYVYSEYESTTDKEALKLKNKKMVTSLTWIRSKIDIEFLTPSRYTSQLPLKILGVIPARYASSRFPGKPLAKINRVEMIKRTYDRVKKSKLLTELVVATDDERIYNFCQSQNMNVMLTEKSHPTGTDRVAEIADKRNFDFYINIQGDEPLIDISSIELVVDGYKQTNGAYDVYNLYKQVDIKEASRDTIIKVVVDNQDQLLYMSRLPIPFEHKKSCSAVKLKKQVCVYGFTGRALREFSACEQKTLNEQHEDIEILRFLDMGYKVKMLEYTKDSISVDVSEDIMKVEKLLLED